MPHDEDTTSSANAEEAGSRRSRGGAHSARKPAARAQHEDGQATSRVRGAHAGGAHSRPGSAKGARRLPKAAIIGICAALVIIVIVVGIVLSGGAGSDEDDMLAAADAAMEAVVSPSEDEQADIAAEISQTMEDAGLSFEDMGIEMQDFATWMFADADYERVSYELEDAQASVTYTVTANKVDTLLTSVSQSIEAMDYEGIESMSEAYAAVGEIMLDLMDESEPTGKDITLTLSYADDEWSVEATQDDILYEVFFE